MSAAENLDDWVSRAMAGADADKMRDIFPWADAMSESPHDPVYHAEGSPWIHTCMVAAALEETSEMKELSPDRQRVARLAAWLHDIGKPATVAFEEDEEGRERVRNPGHAPLGARMAWQALIDLGACPRLARDVHALVFWHMRPRHVIGEGPERAMFRAIGYSIEAGGGSWRELLALTTADQNGRVSLAEEDPADKHLPIDLLREALLDIDRDSGHDLTSGPWPFETDEARLTYMRGGKAASPWYTPSEPTGSRVTIMSGLPGSGKDTWIAENRPGIAVVSLDDIRSSMGISATDDQGRVLQAGFEEARKHLRRGEDFIWNATCLMRQTRQEIAGLACDHGARSEVVSIDVPLSVALERNRNRKHPVPDKVIERLALKREPVMPDEVHDSFSCNADDHVTQVLGKPIESPGPSLTR